MCGFVGILNSNRLDGKKIDRAIINLMNNSLVHRGPDQCGYWENERHGIWLGHRRLAIQDLTSAGVQPMKSACDRYVVAFNGEIYNHLPLRRKLMTEGNELVYRGNSDTETLLACISVWGLERTLHQCVGMFAFCLWDSLEGKLHLVRDRFGEKPLYYGWADKAFIFGSELKALRQYPGFDKSISPVALSEYFRFMYVPAPLSIHPAAFKLEPGCILTISGKPPQSAPGKPIRPGESYGSLSINSYWNLSQIAKTGCQHKGLDDNVSLERLESALSEAVADQSRADVPLGAFLSGGIDSSLVVALMQKHQSKPVRTFTIGFEDNRFDESKYASEVARHLGTDHHEMFVTAEMAQEVIYDLPEIYDEPFADPSQIPTHLVCKAARQHVTVALSGDGGDEIFGGYNRYFWKRRYWKRFSWMPKEARSLLASGLTSVSVSSWNNAASILLGPSSGSKYIGQKVHKLAGRLRTVESDRDLYLSLVQENPDPEKLFSKEYLRKIDANKNIPVYSSLPQMVSEDQAHLMMYLDSISYLPDDILCKVDRASMACSLETRAPFLDHRVAEVAWQIPAEQKISGEVGKLPLREILYKHVPRSLIERPKAGFGVPIGDWLRRDLKPWAESLLTERNMQDDGIFNYPEVMQIWNKHIDSDEDNTSVLWAVLMFRSWFENMKRS